MLVPVGVKYGALQQTGRTAEERKEVKIDSQGERWQIDYNKHTYTGLAKALKQEKPCQRSSWKSRRGRVLIQGKTYHNDYEC